MMKIEKIRVSIGSAKILNSEFLKDPPTTCYLMTYKEGHCTANCGFCPQARDSYSSLEKLSRVIWPTFPFEEFLTKLKYISPLKRFRRICIQTLNYPENFRNLIEILSQIKKVTDIPLSVAIPPMSKEKLKKLKSLGIQRVGIALDGVTPKIFEKIKGKGVNGFYNWEEHFKSLKEALEIFSNGFVSTHLIIGLGETEKEILNQIEELNTMRILVALFAFTPIKGTMLENIKQPDITSFRKIQLARYLILNKNKILKDFTFNSEGNIIKININKKGLRNIIENTNAFLTSGCPDCNRPYYTSKPSGPIYNYPRNLADGEKEEIYSLLQTFVN
ncbi:MAG: radical SAM protein [Promethearchaeota archaeon]